MYFTVAKTLKGSSNEKRLINPIPVEDGAGGQWGVKIYPHPWKKSKIYKHLLKL